VAFRFGFSLGLSLLLLCVLHCHKLWVHHRHHLTKVGVGHHWVSHHWVSHCWVHHASHAHLCIIHRHRHPLSQHHWILLHRHRRHRLHLVRLALCLWQTVHVSLVSDEIYAMTFLLVVSRVFLLSGDVYVCVCLCEL